MRSTLAAFSLGIFAFAGGGCAGDDGASATPVIEDEARTGPKLQYDEYSVLFTNPVCRRYEYPRDQVVLSNKGERLTHKPVPAALVIHW